MIITGGAARDLFLGRGIRDIDVLLPAAYRQTFSARKSLETAMDVWSSDSGSGSISGGIMLGQLDIQFTDSPWAHIENYTIGLCKIMIVKGRFEKHPDFERDIRDKFITFTPSALWPEEKMMSHLRRVRDKYPDFSVREA